MLGSLVSFLLIYGMIMFDMKCWMQRLIFGDVAHCLNYKIQYIDVILQRLSFSLRDAVLGLGTINRLPCLCSSQETLLSQCLPTPTKTGVLNAYLQLWKTNGVGCERDALGLASLEF